MVFIRNTGVANAQYKWFTVREVTGTATPAIGPPVANAVLDQTVKDADGTGSEPVTLNGSASYDPDGTSLTYLWQEGATVLGTTANITYSFLLGPTRCP